MLEGAFTKTSVYDDQPAVLEGDRLLRPAFCFNVLGVGHTTGYELIKNGSLPSVRFSDRCIRIRESALRRFVEERESGAFGGQAA